MFCNNCGCANPDGAKFCSNCGAPLPVPARVPIQPPPQNIPVGRPPVQPKPRKPWYKRWWIWTIVGAVSTITAVALLILVFGAINADLTEAEQSRAYWLNYAQTHEFEEISRDALFDHSSDYENKNIITSVRIYSINTSDEGVGSIKAEAADGSWLFYDLDFIFENSKEVTNYSKGDYVTVMGKVKGKKGIISTVEIVDCHIIDVGESSKVKMRELDNQ